MVAASLLYCRVVTFIGACVGLAMFVAGLSLLAPILGLAYSVAALLAVPSAIYWRQNHAAEPQPA